MYILTTKYLVREARHWLTMVGTYGINQHKSLQEPRDTFRNPRNGLGIFFILILCFPLIDR